MPLPELLDEIRHCRACAAHLTLGPKPVLLITRPDARIILIGQAPGARVHDSGIPWDDASGARLRDWMGVGGAEFYEQGGIAIMPMGFCYPGRGKGGDLPPRPECAPLWHDRLWAQLPGIRLTLLIGRFAQARYLGGAAGASVTETVRNWRAAVARGFFPLVHPSPRNRLWLRQNPWFEAEVVPELRARVRGVLGEGRGG